LIPHLRSDSVFTFHNIHMNLFLRFSYLTFFPIILIIMLVPSLRLFPHSINTSFLFAGLYVPISLRFSQFLIQTIYLPSNFVLTLPSTLFHTCFISVIFIIQDGSNVTSTDYTMFTHKSVPVIFEPPCICLPSSLFFLQCFLQTPIFFPSFCFYFMFISYSFICFIPFLRLIYVGSFCFLPCFSVSFRF
jgi:hypothetical protein